MSQYMPLLQKFAVLKVASSSVEEISSGITAVADWEGFLAEAESHGLSSLILKHIEEHGLDVPPTAKLALKALFVRHRAIADARYTVAAELLDRLQKAGFPALVLKGLALSPLIYPHESLRPMRDVDILIPRQKKAEAAKIIRELGFELLDVHHDKYMRDSNQMPNAWKTVNGFKISVELHHDAIGRDSPGHLYYEDISPTQSVHWRDLVLETLGHEQMLHQLCSHLEGRHPGSLLKLINIADVTLYSEQFIDQVDWPSIAHNYPHVINTLKCLQVSVIQSSIWKQDCATKAKYRRITTKVAQATACGPGGAMKRLPGIRARTR